MIDRIKSRIELKLGLFQTLTLIILMTGFYLVSEYYETKIANLGRTHSQSIEQMNTNLRQEIFNLQSSFGAISDALELDPTQKLHAWLKANKAVHRILEGRGQIKTIFKTRKERRDVSKPNSFVVKSHLGKPAVGIGVFENDHFKEQVDLYILGHLGMEEVVKKIESISQFAKSPEFALQQVKKVKADIADRALASESTRNEILKRIDDLNLKKSALENTTQEAKVILVSLQAAMILVIVIALTIANRLTVTKALMKLQATARSIATNPSIDVPYNKRQDEIGSLARAIERFGEASREAEEMRQQQQAEREKGRQMLEHRLSSVSTQLTNGLDTSFRDLTTLSDELAQLASEIAESARQTTDRSSNVYTHSNSNHQVVSDITSFAARLSEQTNQLSEVINNHKTRTQNTLNETTIIQNQVQELDHAASEVEEIVNLISDISDQTKLLALNATIESARAGSAGKGFAVVANEVKNLARSSAESADSIASRVQRIKAITRSTVKSVANIGEHMQGLHQAMENLNEQFSIHESLSVQINHKTSESKL
ncbi:MAG: methyl-accepting chemotaxis protein, partial [Alphaproteobacteria bacterium]|nr:methyl-accepting chemotaxis protein [Alphaproteobacteria bacterium]